MTEDWESMIADIRRAVEEDDFNLTEWEDEFLHNISNRISLTDKQDDVLVKIWKKATGMDGW